ncbi:MAG: TraB/GumN family protein [Methanosarcinales archaeon]|jgi:pheromone shutdown-related protein TraB|nr:TraB/GumN family protein [Methanosarcinales archaeon]
MKNDTHDFSEPIDSNDTILSVSSFTSTQEADSSSSENIQNDHSNQNQNNNSDQGIQISNTAVSNTSAASGGMVDLKTGADFNHIISVSEDAESIDPTQIIIIGTAHISEKSVREVCETIERERPDIVAVELDHNRYKGMTNPDADSSEISFRDVLRPGQTFYYLLYGFLAYMQKKMGEQLGVPPGSEMMAAVESAHQTNAGIALIDRDIQVTFKRFLAKLGFIEKVKMAYSIVKGMFFGDEEEMNFDINNMTDQDVITAMIEEFRHLSPTAASVLIDERDAYLAGNLLRTVQAAGAGKKIVAVIGAGHREGVMKYLNTPSSIPNLADLDTIPKKRFSLLKIISGGIIALVLLLFAYIIYAVATYPEMTPDVFLLAFGYWFLINGVLSAGGVLVAGGKLRSAATAFLLAWFTSINPLIAVGWFVGLVEAGSRKPTTKDMKSMMNSETFKELNKNSFFKVVYVAALANVGSMIGTFIGAYVVLKISGIDIAELIKNVMTGIF